MSVVKSVAVAGASGNLGPFIVKALVDAKFQVTVLTRSIKPESTYDPSVRVVEVDFKSVDSLTAALKGIDGVVSTVGHAGAADQTILIDAAAAAGVKRFIPSEFGSVSTNPKLETNPLYATMFKIKHYLREKATAGELSWTVLACGAFLNFVLDRPFVVDFKNHKANLFDGGDNRITLTSEANVGKAIAGIFQNFEATKNRVVRASEVILTQNQVLAIAQELKPEIKWETSKTETSTLRKEGLEELRASGFSMPTMMKLLAGTAFAGEEYGSAYDETDNELLGIKELTEEDIKQLVAQKLA